MWLDLFGYEWAWGLLMACGVLAAGVVLLGLAGTRDAPADAFREDQEPWQAMYRKYGFNEIGRMMLSARIREPWPRSEQGDLAPWEFELLQSSRATFLPPDRPPKYRRTLPAADAPELMSSRIGSQGEA